MSLVQEELAASDTDLVMYRQCMHALATDVFHKARKQIYLVGPASSGKSIAMATLVTQMRSLEWLASHLLTKLCLTIPANILGLFP